MLGGGNEKWGGSQGCRPPTDIPVGRGVVVVQPLSVGSGVWGCSPPHRAPIGSGVMGMKPPHPSMSSGVTGVQPLSMSNGFEGAYTPHTPPADSGVMGVHPTPSPMDSRVSGLPMGATTQGGARIRDATAPSQPRSRGSREAQQGPWGVRGGAMGARALNGAVVAPHHIRQLPQGPGGSHEALQAIRG